MTCPTRDALEMCTKQTVFHKIILYNNFKNISFPKDYTNIIQVINAQDSMGLTALHYAVILKHITCIRFLFEFNKTLSKKKIMVTTNTELTDANGKTPLYYAIKFNEYAITNMLLKNNANPNAIDILNDTPLHYAIRAKSLPIVKLLLKYNIVINAKNKKGESPLLLCITENCDTIFLTELLENGADVNIVHPIFNKTPLHYAVAANVRHIVEHLLNEDDIDLNVTDINNETPLHYAVKMCNIDMVKLLLAEKFNNNNIIAYSSIVQLSIKNRCIEIFKYIYEHPNNMAYISNVTYNVKLFHYAIQIKYKEVVEYFIKHDRIHHIDSVDIHKRNALSYAVFYNFEEIIDTLLENRFPLHRYDNEGKIPLYWAIYYKRETIICKFLKYTLNYNYWKFVNNNDNLLHLAIKYQISNYILQKIINFNINSNDVNIYGQTPLHYTIIYHNSTLATVAKTANNQNNHKYYKAYDNFIANKTIEIIEMLRKKNCDINVIDSAGKTPLYYSIEYKLLKIIKYLLRYGGAKIDHSNIFIRNFYTNEKININYNQYTMRYKIIKFITIYLINENRNDLTVFNDYLDYNTNITFYFNELINMLQTKLNVRTSSITLFDLLIANNADIKKITKSVTTKSIEVNLSDWNILFPIYHKNIIRQYNLMLNEETYIKCILIR